MELNFNSEGNIYSQFGEDRLIYDLLAKLNISDNGYCVEFGAHDGEHFSNTRMLTKFLGFTGVLIEADKKKYGILQRKFRDERNIIPLHARVDCEGDFTLDNILNSVGRVPKEFDVLSIDIDGNDYHVWEAFSLFTPKIVIVEFNPTIPNEVRFVQTRDRDVQHGNSARSLYELGCRKGYSLIHATKINLIMVHNSNLHDGLMPRTLDECRTDDPVYIFQGYDGTMFVNRRFFMPWHKSTVTEKDIQFVPFFLRRFPGNYNYVQKQIFLLWKFMRRLLNWIRS